MRRDGDVVGECEKYGVKRINMTAKLSKLSTSEATELCLLTKLVDRFIIFGC